MRRYANDAGTSWRKWGGPVMYVDQSLQTYIDQRIDAAVQRATTFWAFCVAVGAIAAIVVSSLS